jgi:hypothetical protein
MSVKNNPRLDRILDATIVLATKTFGFNIKSLESVCKYVYTHDYDLKQGKKVLMLENILHEICHVIAEDGVLYGKNSNKRQFEGDINELKTLAIQSCVMNKLSVKKWSIKSRVEKLDMPNYDTQLIVTQMMKDREISLQASRLVFMLKELAMDMPGSLHNKILKQLKPL